MKVKSGFILRDVAGKTMVVATGELSKSFHALITMNDSAKFMWQCLENDTTVDEIVAKVVSAYEGVDEQIVKNDVNAFVEKLQNAGVLD
jgi:hypothetical protein